MTDSTRHSRAPLVLIINDQEWSTRSLESILAPNGFAVLRAYTGVKGLERAGSARPDVIVIGASLPDVDGLDLCRRLRADPRIADSTPIIVTTTGQPSRNERLAALRSGAWDFVGHPLDAEELLLRFDAFVAAKHDADRARAEGLVDALTGLYSLPGLARRAREIGSQALREGGPLACAVFRAEFGDVGGDGDFVRACGDVFRSAGRVSDVIGRIGETEFALFAPGTDSQGAERLVTRLSDALQRAHLGTGLAVRAGFFAVDDYRAAALEAQDMLTRATAVLNSRYTPASGAAATTTVH